ncbi:uncharacterized protein [Ambystoma mexicanum]|uniref:uncharacterized protein isoform X3 n=1 Tax=Ambystoma mexicanum TaxID=8296 RepID=UPI0037E9995A
MPHCLANDCKNNSDANPSITFYPFPSDVERAEAWAHHYGVSNVKDCVKDVLSDADHQYYLCSEHFEGSTLKLKPEIRFPQDCRLQQVNHESVSLPMDARSQTVDCDAQLLPLVSRLQHGNDGSEPLLTNFRLQHDSLNVPTNSTDGELHPVNRVSQSLPMDCSSQHMMHDSQSSSSWDSQAPSLKSNLKSVDHDAQFSSVEHKPKYVSQDNPSLNVPYKSHLLDHDYQSPSVDYVLHQVQCESPPQHIQHESSYLNINRRPQTMHHESQTKSMESGPQSMNHESLLLPKGDKPRPMNHDSKSIFLNPALQPENQASLCLSVVCGPQKGNKVSQSKPIDSWLEQVKHESLSMSKDSKLQQAHHDTPSIFTDSESHQVAYGPQFPCRDPTPQQVNHTFLALSVDCRPQPEMKRATEFTSITCRPLHTNLKNQSPLIGSGPQQVNSESQSLTMGSRQELVDHEMQSRSTDCGPSDFKHESGCIPMVSTQQQLHPGSQAMSTVSKTQQVAHGAQFSSMGIALGPENPKTQCLPVVCRSHEETCDTQVMSIDFRPQHDLKTGSLDSNSQHTIQNPRPLARDPKCLSLDNKSQSICTNHSSQTFYVNYMKPDSPSFSPDCTPQCVTPDSQSWSVTYRPQERKHHSESAQESSSVDCTHQVKSNSQSLSGDCRLLPRDLGSTSMPVVCISMSMTRASELVETDCRTQPESQPVTAAYTQEHAYFKSEPFSEAGRLKSVNHQPQSPSFDCKLKPIIHDSPPHSADCVPQAMKRGSLALSVVHSENSESQQLLMDCTPLPIYDGTHSLATDLNSQVMNQESQSLSMIDHMHPEGNDSQAPHMSGKFCPVNQVAQFIPIESSLLRLDHESPASPTENIQVPMGNEPLSVTEENGQNLIETRLLPIKRKLQPVNSEPQSIPIESKLNSFGSVRQSMPIKSSHQPTDPESESLSVESNQEPNDPEPQATLKGICQQFMDQQLRLGSNGSKQEPVDSEPDSISIERQHSLDPESQSMPMGSSRQSIDHYPESISIEKSKQSIDFDPHPILLESSPQLMDQQSRPMSIESRQPPMEPEPRFVSIESKQQSMYLEPQTILLESSPHPQLMSVEGSQQPIDPELEFISIESRLLSIDPKSQFMHMGQSQQFIDQNTQPVSIESRQLPMESESTSLKSGPQFKDHVPQLKLVENKQPIDHDPDSVSIERSEQSIDFESHSMLIENGNRLVDKQPQPMSIKNSPQPIYPDTESISIESKKLIKPELQSMLFGSSHQFMDQQPQSKPIEKTHHLVDHDSESISLERSTPSIYLEPHPVFMESSHQLMDQQCRQMYIEGRQQTMNTDSKSLFTENRQKSIDPEPQPMLMESSQKFMDQPPQPTTIESRALAVHPATEPTSIENGEQSIDPEPQPMLMESSQQFMDQPPQTATIESRALAVHPATEPTSIENGEQSIDPEPLPMLMECSQQFMDQPPQPTTIESRALAVHPATEPTSIENGEQSIDPEPQPMLMECSQQFMDQPPQPTTIESGAQPMNPTPESTSIDNGQQSIDPEPQPMLMECSQQFMDQPPQPTTIESGAQPINPTPESTSIDNGQQSIDPEPQPMLMECSQQFMDQPPQPTTIESGEQPINPTPESTSIDNGQQSIDPEPQPMLMESSQQFMDQPPQPATIESRAQKNPALESISIENRQRSIDPEPKAMLPENSQLLDQPPQTTSFESRQMHMAHAPESISMESRQPSIDFDPKSVLLERSPQLKGQQPLMDSEPHPMLVKSKEIHTDQKPQSVPLERRLQSIDTEPQLMPIESRLKPMDLCDQTWPMEIGQLPIDSEQQSISVESSESVNPRFHSMPIKSSLHPITHGPQPMANEVTPHSLQGEHSFMVVSRRLTFKDSKPQSSPVEGRLQPMHNDPSMPDECERQDEDYETLSMPVGSSSCPIDKQPRSMAIKSESQSLCKESRLKPVDSEPLKPLPALFTDESRLQAMDSEPCCISVNRKPQSVAQDPQSITSGCEQQSMDFVLQSPPVDCTIRSMIHHSQAISITSKQQHIDEDPEFIFNTRQQTMADKPQAMEVEGRRQTMDGELQMVLVESKPLNIDNGPESMAIGIRPMPMDDKLQTISMECKGQTIHDKPQTMYVDVARQPPDGGPNSMHMECKQQPREGEPQSMLMESSLQTVHGKPEVMTMGRILQNSKKPEIQSIPTDCRQQHVLQSAKLDAESLQFVDGSLQSDKLNPVSLKEYIHDQKDATIGEHLSANMEVNVASFDATIDKPRPSSPGTKPELKEERKQGKGDLPSTCRPQCASHMCHTPQPLVNQIVLNFLEQQKPMLSEPVASSCDPRCTSQNACHNPPPVVKQIVVIFLEQPKEGMSESLTGSLSSQCSTQTVYSIPHSGDNQDLVARLLKHVKQPKDETAGNSCSTSCSVHGQCSSTKTEVKKNSGNLQEKLKSEKQEVFDCPDFTQRRTFDGPDALPIDHNAQQQTKHVETFLPSLGPLETICYSPGPWEKQELITFDDIAICFSKEEWEILEDWQKTLYKEVMNENYESLLSLGYPVPKPAILSWIHKQHNLGPDSPGLWEERDTPSRSSCVSSLGGSDWLKVTSDAVQDCTADSDMGINSVADDEVRRGTHIGALMKLVKEIPEFLFGGSEMTSSPSPAGSVEEKAWLKRHDSDVKSETTSDSSHLPTLEERLKELWSAPNTPSSIAQVDWEECRLDIGTRRLPTEETHVCREGDPIGALVHAKEVPVSNPSPCSTPTRSSTSSTALHDMEIGSPDSGGKRVCGERTAEGITSQRGHCRGPQKSYSPQGLKTSRPGELVEEGAQSPLWTMEFKEVPRDNPDLRGLLHSARDGPVGSPATATALPASRHKETTAKTLETSVKRVSTGDVPPSMLNLPVLTDCLRKIQVPAHNPPAPIVNTMSTSFLPGEREHRGPASGTKRPFREDTTLSRSPLHGLVNCLKDISAGKSSPPNATVVSRGSREWRKPEIAVRRSYEEIVPGNLHLPALMNSLKKAPEQRMSPAHIADANLSPVQHELRRADASMKRSYNDVEVTPGSPSHMASLIHFSKKSPMKLPSVPTSSSSASFSPAVRDLRRMDTDNIRQHPDGVTPGSQSYPPGFMRSPANHCTRMPSPSTTAAAANFSPGFREMRRLEMASRRPPPDVVTSSSSAHQSGVMRYSSNQQMNITSPVTSTTSSSFTPGFRNPRRVEGGTNRTHADVSSLKDLPVHMHSPSHVIDSRTSASSSFGNRELRKQDMGNKRSYAEAESPPDQVHLLNSAKKKTFHTPNQSPTSSRSSPSMSPGGRDQRRPDRELAGGNAHLHGLMNCLKEIPLNRPSLSCPTSRIPANVTTSKASSVGTESASSRASSVTGSICPTGMPTSKYPTMAEGCGQRQMEIGARRVYPRGVSNSQYNAEKHPSEMPETDHLNKITGRDATTSESSGLTSRNNHGLKKWCRTGICLHPVKNLPEDDVRNQSPSVLSHNPSGSLSGPSTTDASGSSHLHGLVKLTRHLPVSESGSSSRSMQGIALGMAERRSMRRSPLPNEPSYSAISRLQKVVSGFSENECISPFSAVKPSTSGSSMQEAGGRRRVDRGEAGDASPLQEYGRSSHSSETLQTEERSWLPGNMVSPTHSATAGMRKVGNGFQGVERSSHYAMINPSTGEGRPDITGKKSGQGDEGRPSSMPELADSGLRGRGSFLREQRNRPSQNVNPSYSAIGGLQKVVNGFPQIGCVSPYSVVKSSGSNSTQDFNIRKKADQADNDKKMDSPSSDVSSSRCIDLTEEEEQACTPQTPKSLSQEAVQQSRPTKHIGNVDPGIPRVSSSQCIDLTEDEEMLCDPQEARSTNSEEGVQEKPAPENNRKWDGPRESCIDLTEEEEERKGDRNKPLDPGPADQFENTSAHGISPINRHLSGLEKLLKEVPVMELGNLGSCTTKYGRNMHWWPKSSPSNESLEQDSAITEKRNI